MIKFPQYICLNDPHFQILKKDRIPLPNMFIYIIQHAINGKKTKNTSILVNYPPPVNKKELTQKTQIHSSILPYYL
jgi:hypothetical protein